MPDTTEKTATDTARNVVRHVRVPDDLWIAACTKAQTEGAGQAEMVRSLLRAYVAGRVTL